MSADLTDEERERLREAWTMPDGQAGAVRPTELFANVSWIVAAREDAAYRRALGDAADAWYDGDTDNETIVSEWLRERAAAAAPQETKD